MNQVSPSSPQGRVVSVHINQDGGVPKPSVPQAQLTKTGVEGDKQRDRRYHGGPERAVCLYGRERMEALQAEGHPIAPGSTGENLLIEGVAWDAMQPGVRLTVGDARLEIASYTAPCKTIAQSFVDGAFKRASQKVNPGWSRVYARVLQEGVVKAGDRVQVEEPQPQAQ